MESADIPRSSNHIARLLMVVVLIVIAGLLPPLLFKSSVWPHGALVAGQVGEDYGIFSWNFYWMTESLLAGRNPLESADLYYPLGTRLTKHSYVLGLAPIGLIARALHGRELYPMYAPRIAAHVVLALAFLVSIAALRALRASWIASVTFALAWTFSVFFSQHAAHLHILSGAVILPAITLAITALARRPDIPRALCLALVLGVSVYFGEFSVFALVALAVLAIVATISPITRRSLFAMVKGPGVMGWVLSAVLFTLIASPFIESWLTDEAKPTRPRAAYSWRARPVGFILPDPLLTPLYQKPASIIDPALFEQGTNYESFIFLGFPVLLAAVLGLVLDRRTRIPLFATSVVFLVLSLGPMWIVGKTSVPLPYSLIARVPPFDMLRTPGRLAGVALWCLCVLGALGLSLASDALHRRNRRILAAALPALALLWSLAESRRYGPAIVPIESFCPPRELARLRPGAVVNVPISSMDGLAMFLQVFHRQPILTGYVSRRTLAQTAHVRRLQAAYAAGPLVFARALRGLGASNVIFTEGDLDGLDAELSAQGLMVLDLRRAIDRCERAAN